MARLSTIVVAILVAVMVAEITQVQATIDLKKYEHHAILDPENKFVLYWTYDTTTEVASMAVQVETLGWVGFGLSPNGKMPGSDVFTAWVKDGQVHLQDRFANDRVLPTMDKFQDWVLEDGAESDGKTVITFTRKKNVCNTGTGHDSDDLPIGPTSRLVWAYHSQDPAHENNIPFHEKQGTKTVSLLSAVAKADDPTEPVTHVDLQFSMVIPSATTTYVCKAFKLDDSLDDTQLIKVDPIVSPGNERYMHHMLLYNCDSLDEASLNHQGACAATNTPQPMKDCNGHTPIALWGLGANSFVYPPQAGYPTGKTGAKYLLIEMHYNNPTNTFGVADKSGMRLHLTKQKRGLDAGVFWTGAYVSSTMVIPPKQVFTVKRFCPVSCFDKLIPDDGLNVFAVMLHAHTLAVKLSADLYRDGKFYMHLAKDDYYDFNFQDAIWLFKHVKLLQGDSIQVSCVYDSSDKDFATVGGSNTLDEMCLAYLFYYPYKEGVTMTRCLSGINVDTQVLLSNRGYLPDNNIKTTSATTFDWSRYQQGITQLKNEDKWTYSCTAGGNNSWWGTSKYPFYAEPAATAGECPLDGDPTGTEGGAQSNTAKTNVIGAANTPPSTSSPAPAPVPAPVQGQPGSGNSFSMNVTAAAGVVAVSTPLLMSLVLALVVMLNV
eukprot:GFYU01009014.1.p1 GENE.GFYU01009014.1~~GFYU01009014.1.p1  ORF type:complete len:659 (+),score=192.89 GFYU01009014.1:131-2107(+)